MKELLENLFLGGRLTRAEAARVLNEIVEGAYPPAQVAALLSSLRMRPIEPDELLGFRDALLSRATLIDLATYSPIDVCGTGGDSKNTFNISTTTAFVLAGCGVTVAKHGNYAFSSSVGSSNVVEALGVKFPTTPDEVLRHVDCAGICFLHAPIWHPAMKSVAPIRKELGFRTFFNLLGPLVNPTRPTAQLIGVATRPTLNLYHRALAQIGTNYSIAWSSDGHDEVSLTSDLVVATPKGEELLNPESFKLKKLSPSDLVGGNSIADASAIVYAILMGQGSPAQCDVVSANAALALKLINPKESLPSCVAKARESIASGRALNALKRLQELNR